PAACHAARAFSSCMPGSCHPTHKSRVYDTVGLTARFERGGCDRVKWAPPPLVAVGEEDRSFLETRMWRPADRVLVGDFGAGQALSDGQYRLIEPMIPRPKPGGRPRTTDMRR